MFGEGKEDGCRRWNLEQNSVARRIDRERKSLSWSDLHLIDKAENASDGPNANKVRWTKNPGHFHAQ